MENTLQVNDRVIVSLWTPTLDPLKRGDVVVFTDPGGWLPQSPTSPSALNNVFSFIGLAAPDSDDHLIKRVIGLPGDTVTCCDTTGHLTINGTAIVEPYILLPQGETRADKYPFTATVPKGDLWMLGDNRYNSGDSAFHFSKHDESYFVPESDVVGRAIAITYPVSRWTSLGDYPGVFSGVGHSLPVIVPRG
jgi:signal peptidase I